MSWVVNASIAVKWVIPEMLNDTADRVRDGEDDILAPDLLLVEVAHALWRKTTAKEISSREADVAFDLVRRSGIELRPTEPLLSRAMDVARRLDHPSTTASTSPSRSASTRPSSPPIAVSCASPRGSWTPRSSTFEPCSATGAAAPRWPGGP